MQLVRYGLFILILLATFPLANWLRRNPQYNAKAWILIGLLPFVTSIGPHPLYFAIISWEWVGYVKGVEWSALDTLALAIYLSQPRVRYSLPFMAPMALYFISVLVSAAFAGVPMASLFYAWQLARMFLVYVVVTRGCADKQVPHALLTGMTLGLCIAGADAAWQHFALGAIQPGGTVGDKNLLGMMSHFVGLPAFAVILAGERGRIPVMATAGCILTVILTVSRAALGLTAFGMILIFVTSSLRAWTPRKAKIGVMGVCTAVLVLPAVWGALDNRFSVEPLSGSYDERAAFDRAAELMLTDHPGGVGANNYVVVANVDGYDDKAGVVAVRDNRSTNVHNAFLLSAAETGYFGVIAFVLLLARPLAVAFLCGWKNRNDHTGDYLLGLAIALLMVYIHCFFEWIFFIFPTQYLFAITVGLVAGLAQQLGYWRDARNALPKADNVATRNLTSWRAG